MTPPAPATSSSVMLRAYAIPFAVFMLFLGLVGLVKGMGRTEFIFADPQYWIYPLQTLVCGALLIYYWRHYGLDWPKKWGFTLGIAILVLIIWISPQILLGAEPRLEGFNPEVFPPDSSVYWGTLALRFLRLVIVVPLLEEIFWRGFLLRYLIREDFEKIPFGSASRFSFIAVTLAFGLAHYGNSLWPGPDFLPAILTGALYNWVAIRTRSLGSCVLAHAVTNLLLGIYIMTTRQWGFW